MFSVIHKSAAGHCLLFSKTDLGHPGHCVLTVDVFLCFAVTVFRSGNTLVNTYTSRLGWVWTAADWCTRVE